MLSFYHEHGVKTLRTEQEAVEFSQSVDGIEFIRFLLAEKRMRVRKAKEAYQDRINPRVDLVA